MQYRPTLLVLTLLLVCPSIANAQAFSQAPFLILSSGVILLLTLSAYVIVKIRQHLKQDLKKPAK